VNILCNILTVILGRNFNVNIVEGGGGRMPVKHAVERGNLDSILAFALGPEKTTEELYRVGRSQDLPEAD
jgi:hypothetical protein